MKKHLGLALALLFWAGSASALIRYVPGQYPTIQAAVNASQVGDNVVVAPGVYTDVTHSSGGAHPTLCSVIMKSGITVSGAGAGATIVDCDSLGRGFHCRGVTNAVIENLTIRRAFSAVHGAAIFCDSLSSPTIRNCEITRNYDGGIICDRGSSPTISGCQLTDNIGKQGGALFMDNGSAPQVYNCLMTGNQAPSGGAIQLRSSSGIYIGGCLIQNNSISQVTGSGGGISSVVSGATIENCYLVDNIASAGGGGIYASESTLIIRKCLLQGNTTTGPYGPGGGIFIDFSSDVTLDGCTITRNSVAGTDLGPPDSDGGGICAFFATQVIIRQCTIAANGCQLAQGGGITCWQSPMTIEKSIIAFNDPGRGLYCTDGASLPVVSCTDLYGNAGGNTICGTNAGHNFSLDPLFCDLGADDYRLQSSSPCAAGHHPEGPTACDGSRLGARDLGCAPAGVEDGTGSHGDARLLGNDPNPFRPATTIRFELARAAQVSLCIFDVAGRQVRALQTGPLEGGRHQAIWDGRSDRGELMPSGVYFYRLKVDGVEHTRRMILAR